MPSPPLFLTAELELGLDDPHTLELRYPGDVHLAHAFGRQLGAVWAGGDLDLEVPLVTGTCVAQGVLNASSDVDAIRLTARELHLSGDSIRARALSATERIVIGPCKLKVDVIIAPIIEIHPEASGRVTVIESQNARGPTKIKGGFSLEEYNEIFGDGPDFLAARDVVPLNQDPGGLLDDITPLPDDAMDVEAFGNEEEPVESVVIEDLDPEEDLDEVQSVEIEPLDDPEELEPVDLDELEPLDDPGLDVVDELQPDALEDLDDDRLVDAPSLSPDDEDDGIIEGASGLPPRAPTPAAPAPRKSLPDAESVAWFQRVTPVLHQVRDAYDEVPAPITELVAIASEGDFDAFDQGLVPAWTELIRQHHQERRPVHPRVSHGFRVLNDLVEQGPWSAQ